MKYALNLEAEALGDYSELDEFEEEATDGFSELDEYSDHKFESYAEFDPEFDEAETEAEMMRGRHVAVRALGTRPDMRRPRFRPRVIRRRPGLAIADPSVCTCPAPRCPRHGSEYVRWVQSALNQIMNLRLSVTGIMNAETRSALRSFQQKQGLPVDGIAGPETKEALIAAKGEKSPEAGVTKPAGPVTTPARPDTAEPTPPASEFDFEWENFNDERERDFSEYEFEAEKAPPARAARFPARKYPPFSLEPILQRTLGRAKPKQELEFFGGFSEVEGELTGARLTAAVAANRRLARQLGWGCVVNDRLQLNETPPRPRLYELLGLGASPSEEDFAQAVERFQQTELRQPRPDGQLGTNTWNQLRRRGALPATRFAPFSKPVFFGGRKLGVLEKTRAYERCFFDPVIDSPCRAARSGIAGEGGGAIIELGFRVTDADAVRRAGFVDGFGEDFFRWIQVIDFITVPVLNAAGGLTGFVRRASGEVDPTAVAGIPGEQLDLHPYYWDEVTHPGAHPGLNIDQWVNRRAQNGLCYDLIFMDRATFPLSTVFPPAPWTRPGSHAYFNFELALIGVRPGPPIQNFVLYTVKWGYDIFMKGGQPNVDLNGLHPGPTKGSPDLKKILNREFNRDDVPFPGHCMVGSGYTGRANCKK